MSNTKENGQSTYPFRRWHPVLVVSVRRLRPLSLILFEGQVVLTLQSAL